MIYLHRMTGSSVKKVKTVRNRSLKCRLLRVRQSPLLTAYNMRRYRECEARASGTLDGDGIHQARSWKLLMSQATRVKTGPYYIPALPPPLTRQFMEKTCRWVYPIPVIIIKSIAIHPYGH